MLHLPFVKMQGIGNDYIYFDCLKYPDLIPESRLPEIARKVSDRHFGVGGDGIILICPHAEADFEMRMFNADGSEAQMCGNGIRCFAKFIYDKGYTDKTEVAVMTGAGLRKLSLIAGDAKVEKVRVDMGEPVLNGKDIPTVFDKNPVINESVTLPSGKIYPVTCVSMGNPHAVIFVENITDEMVLTDGRALETIDVFPERINVEFCQLISRSEVKMRVWERGSGETLACGTGASATVVACILNHYTERNVTVHLLGGALEIEWRENDNHVYMTGPCETVFEGTIAV